MPSHMGAKIRALRNKCGMSLERLAEETNSSKSYMWELENKEAPKPSADKIRKIAAALKVTSEYLLSDDGAEPSTTIIDEAFFLKYKRMPAETKKRLRQVLDAWSDDE